MQVVSRQKVGIAVLRRLTAYCESHETTDDITVFQLMFRVQDALDTLLNGGSFGRLCMEDIWDAQELKEDMNVLIRRMTKVRSFSN